MRAKVEDAMACRPVFCESLGQVLFLPLSDIARLPIELANLLCATGLPDTAALNLEECLATLRKWASVVELETERQMYRFVRDPEEFYGSEAYFRVLVMITLLQRDLGVRYNPDAAKTRKFDDSREAFLHGLLTAGNFGTCANMPVLYAAIGRRLGYPIYLVQACGHMFCRWASKDGRERFNIEATGQGLTVHPDGYYMNWPSPIDDNDVRSGLFLRNLDPTEELATFMATRGHCLFDRDHVLDAVVAYSHAHRLAPTDPHHMTWLMEAINRELELRAAGSLPACRRDAEELSRRFEAGGQLPVRRYILDDRFDRFDRIDKAFRPTVGAGVPRKELR